MSWTEQVLAALSAKGHRVTGPRRAILEQITHYQQPFSAEQLWADMNTTAAQRAGPIGRATIYRTVDLLVEEHWLTRVHWRSSKETATESEHAYVLIEQGHQHHLICKNCGTVVAKV